MFVAVVVSAAALVLVGMFAVRSASVEIGDVRAASIEHAASPSEHAPPSQFALDKMTEALLWAWADDERVEFVRQDIQRVMGCAPTASLHDEIDPRDAGALEAFKDDLRRFTVRHDPADGYLIGEAQRPENEHGLERLSIAWRCSTS
ncbi:MAG: hypothetical protein ACRDGK_07350 [Actinomycetota bacterium]